MHDGMPSSRVGALALGKSHSASQNVLESILCPGHMERTGLVVVLLVRPSQSGPQSNKCFRQDRHNGLLPKTSLDTEMISTSASP